jgi:hypothetical protein
MTDPSDLLRRASELTDRADYEEDIEVMRMAAYYVLIAESEEWLAAHPTSIASVTELLNSRIENSPGGRSAPQRLSLLDHFTMPARRQTAPVDR